MKIDPMPRSPILVLHYNELWLKGCNRPFFVGRLRNHVERTLEDLDVSLSKHVDSRIVIRAADDEVARVAVARLQRVPGIQYIASGYETEPTETAILDLGAELMRRRGYDSFAVRARRSVKNLPFRSGEIERKLGARVLDEARADDRKIHVDLKHPDTTCFVEATPDGAFVYSDKEPGVGGLPTNTAGRLGCLLSGGLDSPVAAYKILRRGVRLNFIHFHGAPARPGEESPPIAREIVKILTPYQGLSRLFLVPFDDVQREILVSAPDEFRLLLYRRFMFRIAERIARPNRCRGLVTGDSIAQVASQTLANLEAVSSVTEMPVYRPLCGDDKHEIMTLARKIGTYAVSTEPFADCCPMYMPRNPRVFSHIEELDEAESRLDIPGLVETGLSQVRREVYEYRTGDVRLRSVKDYYGRTAERAAQEEAVAG